MDFLKALMLYMTLTFSVGVEGAPTPEITQVPTPSPTAAVETVRPEETAAASDPGIAAAFTATPVPEVTITPNPGYRLLKVGVRGDNVRKLQQRLIELGYLKGEADGVYGNQTRRAVISFQYYNGLQQDGAAGKATQTVLFESPSVVANPNVTPTPDPTPSPIPTQNPTPEATINVPEESEAPAESAVKSAKLTEAPTAEPTEAPTAEPTAGPTEAPTAEPTAGPQSTAESVTETELLNVPDETILLPIDGASVVINDAGENVSFTVQQDGVLVRAVPDVYLSGANDLYVSLTDLCAGFDGWSMNGQEEEFSAVVAGYELKLRAPNAQSAVWSVHVDGQAAEIAPEDVLLQGNEVIVSTAFLRKTVLANTIWDAEENTLMIRVQDKDVANAKD